MHTYIFSEPDILKHLDVTAAQIKELLHQLAAHSDTTDLVVSTYFLKHSGWYGGTAYVSHWVPRRQFQTRRGKWNFTRQFPLPPDLPDQFKLIRLLPAKGLDDIQYPARLQDIYGWELYYPDFLSHLAFLFAHELHHFRRYHLGLHPAEGEKSANRWALAQVQAFGFQVTGKVLPRRRVHKFQPFRILSTVLPDPFAEFRDLAAGQMVYIHHDPRARYAGVVARVERPARRRARRLAIRTPDAKVWLWPMIWLKPIHE
ncbi:hypothetical protein L0128_05415 [candidate division KSB1 bacterium]|nr:hypothetical protein [candidate division KSB1 bacterium]